MPVRNGTPHNVQIYGQRGSYHLWQVATIQCSLFTFSGVKYQFHSKEWFSMNLLELHYQLIQRKIALLHQGTEAGLVAILGDDWEKIGSSGERKQFGRLFKAAVLKNQISSLEWIRIENSGRFDVYRKV